ncbi:hypothetical protein GWK08_16840 [Leptobacterium flavescens]|uniref:REase AHJR-like domain-containing protein n=1 Tax=Leptobacterium flavescens TaxID=472055 RepID=A0A6P0UP66_9FLAO|nr:hypothetical protein [Leptobacterium flavescens]NER15124.1 hypothetical protein [Leptobacterium flavescens]
MMQKDYYIELEEKKVRELANEYKKKGYLVYTYPSKENVPPFLDDYKPDLIAISENEKLIIEVKSKSSIKSSDKLTNYIELINRQKEWKFELVLTNPKKKISNEHLLSNFVEIEEIDRRLNEINELIQANFLEPAFLYAWVVFEAVSRNQLVTYKKQSKSNIESLIKELFSYGIVNKAEYNFLQNSFHQRNNLIHGFYNKTNNINEKKIKEFVKLITQIKENEN